jgi:hypothetical protein
LSMNGSTKGFPVFAMLLAGIVAVITSENSQNIGRGSAAPGAIKEYDGLECTLAIGKTARGIVQSIALSLRNPFDQPVTVRTNSVQRATLLLDIFDEHGQKLTVGARRFSTEERQQFDEAIIAAHARKEWRVSISERLLPNVDLKMLITASLSTSLIYSVKIPSGRDFQNLVCTLSESGVLLGEATRGPR